MATQSSRPAYSPGDPNGEFKNGLGFGEGQDCQAVFCPHGIFYSKTKLTVAIGILFLVTFFLAFILLLTVLLASSELLPLLHPLPKDGSCPTVPSSTAQPISLKAGATFQCGNSAAEARAAGCVFDLMSAAWLPLECFDSELNAEFMELGPWNFYSSNSTEWDLRNAPEQERFLLPTVEAIGNSPELLWTDRRFHLTHCVFGWKIMHRAVERGWKLEGSLATYHHTEHCSNTLTNTSVPLDAIMTRVEMSFPAC